MSLFRNVMCGGILSLYSSILSAVEFRGEDYEIYIGDLNGDSIQDVYLKSPSKIVLLHGDIIIPLVLSSDIPSYLISSFGVSTRFYTEPRVVKENVDHTEMTLLSEEEYWLDDVNLDGSQDLVISANNLLYEFTISGHINTPAKIINTAVAPLSPNSASFDPVSAPIIDELYNGYISGDHNITRDGVFEYSIPIKVLPGINEVAPNISIAYSSEATNGLLGWGWGISGVPYIHRCSTDIAREGMLSGINNGDAYMFCMDGVRLVEIAEGEYRTELESQTKVVRIGVNPTAPESWLVYQKDGSRLSFGEADNSKREDGDGATMEWFLSVSEDRFSNYMELEYFKNESRGEHWLAKIVYTKNRLARGQNREIRFDYEDRPDEFSHYSAGARKYYSKRLSSIVMLDNNVDIYSYELSYDEGNDPSRVSRLSSMERCLPNLSECEEKLNFDWSDSGEDTYNFSSLKPNEYFGSGDFNGDGELDTIKLEVSSSTARFRVRPFKNPGQLDGDIWISVPLDSVRPRPFILDINGDGFDDLVFDPNAWYGPEANQREFTYFESNGSSFEKKTWSGYGSLVDLNGDGLLDFMNWKAGHDSDSGIFVRLNSDGELGQSQRWYGGFFTEWVDLVDIGYPGSRPPTGIRNGDFDGDGLMDLFLCARQETDTTVCRPTFLMNTGSGFQLQFLLSGYRPEQARHLVDMNGDGKTDFVSYDSSGIKVELSNGNGFEDPVLWSDILKLDHLSAMRGLVRNPAGSRFPPQIINFSDLNNDGCADLTYYGSDGGPWELPTGIHVAISRCSSQGTAAGFSNTLTISQGQIVTHFVKDTDEELLPSIMRFGVSPISPRPLSMLDLDGDGLLDIQYGEMTNSQDADSIIFRDGFGIGNSRKLTSIWNGNDKSTIKYTSILDSESYLSDATLDAGGLGFISRHTSYRSVQATMIGEPGQDGGGVNFGEMGTGGGKAISYVRKPKIVVRRVDHEHEGAPIYSDEFRYKNYRASRYGWGSLGFQEVEKTNINLRDGSSVRTVENFLQEIDEENRYKLHVLDGTVKCVISDDTVFGCLGGEQSNLITKERKNWRVKLLGESKIHYIPYIVDTELQVFDLLTGALLKTTRKGKEKKSDTSCEPFVEIAAVDRTLDLSLIDAFGNPYRVVEKTCDSFGVVGTDSLNGGILNNVENWCIGLVQDPSVESWHYLNEGELIPSVTRSNSMQYEGCDLHSKTREPNGSPNIWLKEVYSFDDYGYTNSTTQFAKDFGLDGISFTTRENKSDTTYDELGRKTIVSTNVLGHESTEYYDSPYDVLTKSVDSNGIEEELLYDGYGRVVSRAKDGVLTAYQYYECNLCFEYNQDAVYYIWEKQQGRSAHKKFFDSFDRELGQNWVGSGGQAFYSGVKLNYFDSPDSQATAFQNLVDLPSKETTFSYDALGRLVETIYPNGGIQQIRYGAVEGAAQIIKSDSLGRESIVLQDGLGRERRVTDPMGNFVEYFYDSGGNTTKVNVSAMGGSSIQHDIKFDLLGRKVELLDPDLGSIKYTYNTFGHQTSQVNSESEVICYFFDKAGRISHRLDRSDAGCTNGIEHSWSYDDTGEIGLLSSISGVDTEGKKYQELYAYTSEYLKPKSKTLIIDDELYTITSFYDSFGRLTGRGYPTGFSTQTNYDVYGLVKSVVNTQDGDVLWENLGYDERGNATDVIFGNQVRVQSNFYDDSGLLEKRKTFRGDELLQDHHYTYDTEGNLRSRIDSVAGISQSFCYDPLYRVTDSVVSASCVDDEGAYTGTLYAYDGHGNLTRKDGINDFKYGEINKNAGPHAVSYANGESYTYDMAGRMVLSPAQRVIDYTDFGKPSYMGSVGGFQTSIKYGSTQNRIVKRDVENGQLNHTVYADKYYERIDTPDGREHRYYIEGRGVHIVNESDESEYNVYLTRDHIGSIITKSDDRSVNNLQAQMLANGVWGQRQEENWGGQLYDTLNIDQIKQITHGTSRGFTDHEHLDGVGLIHMNGRVYDPVIGRFISPDPWIQNPESTQSFNRYSYVLNNPLRYTDPTGELACMGLCIGAVALVGWGMTAWGVHDAAVAVTESVADVTSGKQTASGAVKEFATTKLTDIAIDRVTFGVTKVIPDSKKNWALDKIGDTFDALSGNKNDLTDNLNAKTAPSSKIKSDNSLDPDGEYVYAIRDEGTGEIKYFGISNDPPRRAKEHLADPDKEGSMEVLTKKLNHDNARTLEAKLIRERLAEARAEGLIDGTEPVREQLKKAGLVNKNRGRTPDRWSEDGLGLDDLGDLNPALEDNKKHSFWDLF